jgi:hypothetical protein
VGKFLKQDNTYIHFLFLISVAAILIFIPEAKGENIDKKTGGCIPVENDNANEHTNKGRAYPLQALNYAVGIEELTIESVDAKSYFLSNNSDNPQEELCYIRMFIPVKYHKSYYWYTDHQGRKAEKKQWLRFSRCADTIVILNPFIPFTTSANSNVKSHPPPSKS